MHQESARLESFGNNWPHPANTFKATPTKLAASGFYLAPSGHHVDRTVCFCCGIALVHWNKDSDPWDEHIKRSPTCGFTTGFYKRYFEEEARLSSFKNWPCPGTFVATPVKLASAGFFLCPRDQYLDRSVCFCCGLALVRWESQDDPWTEHQNHSKLCPFVSHQETGNVPISCGPEEKSESSLETLIAKVRACGVDPGNTAPSYFFCPIMQDIFLDPVVAEDGHTYEKFAIKKWLENHNTSPLTNKKLYSKRLIPNHNLNTQMLDFIEKLIEEHGFSVPGTPNILESLQYTTNEIQGSLGTDLDLLNPL